MRFPGVPLVPEVPLVRTVAPRPVSIVIKVATPVQEARWLFTALCGDCEAPGTAPDGHPRKLSLERYVRGLAGPSDFEDVLQDVLLIVYRKLKLLEQPEVFRAGCFASRVAQPSAI